MQQNIYAIMFILLLIDSFNYLSDEVLTIINYFIYCFITLFDKTTSDSETFIF